MFDLYFGVPEMRDFWIELNGSITIIGLEPHPNDNKHSYEKITLSSTTD